MKYDDVSFSSLLGQTLKSVEPVDNKFGEEFIGGFVFETEEGNTYIMYHRQDCCESVDVHDWEGEWEDVIGSPLLKAEEVEGYTTDPLDPEDAEYGSYTWTFYKLATIKGYFDLRWYGTSNGYYSESVDFVQITEK